jgi:hypothetical protein
MAHSVRSRFSAPAPARSPPAPAPWPGRPRPTAAWTRPGRATARRATGCFVIPAPVRREPTETGRVLKLHPDELVRAGTAVAALPAPAEPDLAGGGRCGGPCPYSPRRGTTSASPLEGAAKVTQLKVVSRNRDRAAELAGERAQLSSRDAGTFKFERIQGLHPCQRRGARPRPDGVVGMAAMRLSANFTLSARCPLKIPRHQPKLRVHCHKN